MVLISSFQDQTEAIHNLMEYAMKKGHEIP